MCDTLNIRLRSLQANRRLCSTGYMVIKNRFNVLGWVITDDTLWFSRQQRDEIDKAGQRWFTSRTVTVIRTISKTNQGMSRESARDQRGYHGINQLVQGGGAINTVSHIYKLSKWLRKGLNLTCNLTGQRVSTKEDSESLRRTGSGEEARVMKM